MPIQFGWHDVLVLDSASSSSGSVRLRLAVALVLVGVAVPAVLWWLGHQAVDRVSAATGAPVCQGTEPTTVTDGTDGFGRTAIPMTAGFECTLTIRVVNHSDHEVTLDQVLVPAGGQAGGAGFRVTHVGGVEVPSDDDVDAVVDLAHSVDPGAEQLVDVELAFRESGCTARGQMTIDPTIVVNDLLASRELTLIDLPALLGTADTFCRS